MLDRSDRAETSAVGKDSDRGYLLAVEEGHRGTVAVVYARTAW